MPVKILWTKLQQNVKLYASYCGEQGAYMANIKAVYRYVDELNRSKFNSSRCLLTISVGQEVHEDEKFDATVNLINDSFKECIMMIDDSLQRHTMVLDRKESAEEFYQISVKEGDLWLSRNEQYYSKMNNLSRIIRWDHWLKNPNYLTKKKTLQDAITKDASFAEIFDNTINEFLTRYFNRLFSQSDFNMARGYQLCFDYLLEECTAMCLWPELDCHFEVYPSKRNFAMDETHRRYVLPFHKELLHAVAIKFKNRKQFNPQRFTLIDNELTESLLID